MDVKIRMYDCGFGDCFRLENEEYGTLYVDFGIHSRSMNKACRELRYNQIIGQMQNESDFLLTHYHDDHYAGAIHMGKSGKKFHNVYIPDIWKIKDSVDVIKLTLLRGLITRSVLTNGYSLISFLQSICCSTGKINFVRRGSVIQNKYIALWPDEEYIRKRTQKVVGELDEVDESGEVWRSLSELAEKLNELVLELEETQDLESKDKMVQVLETLDAEYIELAKRLNRNENLQHKLSKYGNEISIVFQNQCKEDRKILFTGDVGKKRVWNLIENNFDGEISMHDQYSVIKIPHHGTNTYYHSFCNRCNDTTKLLIPNGKIKQSSWFIDRQYSLDANATESTVVCADNAACNAIRCGRACSKYKLISNEPCPYIEV